MGLSFFVIVEQLFLLKKVQDMNNTALRAGLLSASGTCSATTGAERRPQSASNTHRVFANEEHKKFYYEKLAQVRYQDCIIWL